MTFRDLLVRAFGAGAFLLVIVACGPGEASSPPSARILQACDGLCEKGKECKGAIDVERCKSRCSAAESIRRVESFRPEASDAMLACLTANVCEPDHDAMGKRCVHDVAQKLTVSPKVKALCVKLEDAFAACGTKWNAPCTEELRLFADQDLDGFGECVDRSCRGGANCFREAEHAILAKPH
jgi:hypothetical protein